MHEANQQGQKPITGLQCGAGSEAGALSNTHHGGMVSMQGANQARGGLSLLPARAGSGIRPEPVTGQAGLDILEGERSSSTGAGQASQGGGRAGVAADQAGGLGLPSIIAFDDLPENLRKGFESDIQANAHLQLVKADTLKPEPIRWIWPGWLAAGKLHVLAGAPGCGKTTIGLQIISTITRGGYWPNGARAPQGSALVWSGEDDPRDTLVPRLIASGADLSRIHFVGDIRDEDGNRPFNPSTDMPALLEAAASGIDGLRLLLVDPIVSAVAGDSHKNAEVRRGLQPLVDFGQRVGAAVLGVSHFTKGTSGRDPLERVTGSLAFGALARVVLGAAKKTSEEGEETRVFVRLKSNIGPDGGGFTYALTEHEISGGIITTTADFGEAIEGAAREILAECNPMEDGDGGAVGDAMEFLRNLLSDGPMETKAIKADADGAGYSWASIRRAQKVLGVDAYRDGFGKGGSWKWQLTPKVLNESKDAHPKKLNTFGDSEHLCSDWTVNDDVEIEL